MLTFMNSKLPDKLVVLTSKTKFSKKENPIKYPVQTYILVRPGIYYPCILLVYSIRP